MTFILHVVLIGTNYKKCNVIVPMEDFNVYVQCYAGNQIFFHAHKQISTIYL